MEMYSEDYGELMEYYKYVEKRLKELDKEVDENTLNDIVSNYVAELNQNFGMDAYDDLDKVIENQELLDEIIYEHANVQYK